MPESKLESIRFRTTLRAKKDFQEACSKNKKDMSEVLNNFILRYAFQEGVSNAPFDL